MAQRTILKLGSRGAEVRTLQHRLNLITDGIFGPITQEAVITFQASHGLAADGIVGEKTWLALGIPASPVARSIREIIIHCAATPEGKDYSVADIRRWHLDRGFADIGYHFVIYRDGSIHTGRELAKIGAHCTGHNANSIGICYIGGYAADSKTPKDTRTPAQRTALISLVHSLRSQYPSASVHGHNEFAAKACPSFNVQKEKELCGK